MQIIIFLMIGKHTKKQRMCKLLEGLKNMARSRYSNRDQDVASGEPQANVQDTINRITSNFSKKPIVQNFANRNDQVDDSADDEFENGNVENQGYQDDDGYDESSVSNNQNADEDQMDDGGDLESFFSSTPQEEDVESMSESMDQSDDGDEDDNVLGFKQNTNNSNQNADDKSVEIDYFGKMNFGQNLDNNPRIGVSKTQAHLQKRNEPKEPRETRSSRTRERDDDEDDDNDENLKGDTLTLYQWCEQFRFTAGVEFLKLRREHPQQWEGIIVGGWLEDIQEPIDEKYIIDKWGGGTYKIDAIQLDRSGRPKIAKRKYTTISGVPTQFTDDKGNLHTLQRNNKASHSWRENNMNDNKGRVMHRYKEYINQRSESDFGYGYDDETPQKPAQAIPQGLSAAEMLKMQQLESEKQKEGSRALEILRAAQSDVQSQMTETAKHQQQLYAEILNTQRQEISRMRQEQDVLFDKAQRPLSDALNVINERAEKESSILREQLQKLEGEYRDRFGSIKEDQNRFFMIHQKEKDDLRNMHNTQLESLKNEMQRQFLTFQKEKEELRNNHLQQIEIIKEDHQKQFTFMHKEKEELRVSFNKQIEMAKNDQHSQTINFQKEKDDLRSVYLQQIENLKGDHQLQSANTQKEKEDIKNTFSKQIEAMKQDHANLIQILQREKEELKATNQAQMETLRQEFRQRESELKQTSQSTTSETYQNLRTQMDGLRDSHQNQIGNLQKESQNTINTLYQEINKLREDARERESKAREEGFKRESELRMTSMKELADLRADNQEKINQIRLDYEKREKDLKENFAKIEKDLKENFAKAEKDLKENAEKMDKASKDRYESNLKETKERYELQEKTLRESLETKYQGTIESLKEKADVYKINSDEKVRDYIKDTERREKQLQSMLETNHRAQMSILEAERDRLKNELESNKKELDYARKEKRELTDPIAKLKEIRNFKETLQQYGFVGENDGEKEKSDIDEKLEKMERMLESKNRKDDDDEKEPPAPKDFLGKIAHYGPSIAQNILAPVLSRVDSATRVANDALEAQKMELANQNRMLEIQSQEMEQNKKKLEIEAEERRIRLAQDREMRLEQLQLEQQQSQMQQQRLANLQSLGGMGQSNRIPRQSRNTIVDTQYEDVEMRANEGLNRRRQALDEKRLQKELEERKIKKEREEFINLQQRQKPNDQDSKDVMSNTSDDVNDVVQGDNEIKIQPNAFRNRMRNPDATPPPSFRQNRVNIDTSSSNAINGRKINLGGMRKQNTNINNKDLTNEIEYNIDSSSQNFEQNNGDTNMPANEGYIRLAEFIDGELASKNSPKDSANKLKAAVTWKMLPKEVLDDALNQSFDSLYTNVQMASQQKSYNRVLSQQGLEFCQGLYNELKNK